MAVVTWSRKEFERQLEGIPDLYEKIHLFGTPVESLTNAELQIEVFQNRPDLLSMHGFLRSFKAFIGREMGVRKYIVKKPRENEVVKIDPSVGDVRPFTACAIVRGLSLTDEKICDIIAIQEKLHATLGRNRKRFAIGVYPLEKITFPIVYEARTPEKIVFVPLDSDHEMNAIQILQKHQTGRMYAHLLEGMTKYPIFIDAKSHILSMPPIINSNETGKITEATHDVFIECSGFQKEILHKTLIILTTMLADMGGTIHAIELQYDKKNSVRMPDLNPEKIKISLENVNKLLGLTLKEVDLEKLLPRMGYDYKNRTVIIPPWRMDVIHEVDIIEDIAIAYGYEKFIPEIPNIYTIGEEDFFEEKRRAFTDTLTGLGFLEISTYHLIKQYEAETLKKEERIEVENARTDYKILRPNLLIPALRILAENKDHEYPQKIFEIGVVFEKSDRKEESKIKETRHLLIASSSGNFTTMKQILDYISHVFALSLTLKESMHPSLIRGRTATIFAEKRAVGYIGECHPETLRDLSIKMPVAVIELSLDEIL